MAVTVPKRIARYQILKHLKSGGMGSVFLARDPAIDRLVAIKLLREGMDNADLRERFVREARSAGRLQHLNIVTIFDVGEHEDQPFIAMEYVDGETLSTLIQDRVKLSFARKLQLMDELCAGLQFAHRGGIVHRDIKPQNIMLDRDGVLKILDFGIARVTNATGGPITMAGMLMGSLNYMAPEQMLGVPDLDMRADIFAAGTVFYELLSYKQAFPGGLGDGIMHKIISVAPEPLQVIDPSIDPAAIEVVNRCLEKSRESRYSDMAAVRRHLAPLKRRYPIEEEDEGSRVTVVNPPVFSEPPPLVGTPRPSMKRDPRDLDRLRTEQIRGHLDDGRKALAAGDYTLALTAVERVLVLDEYDAEALELDRLVRAAIEARQIADLLGSARGELDRGMLTSASRLVDQALSVDASSADAIAAREQVDHARRQLAEAEERGRLIEATLSRARGAVSGGDLDGAAKAVGEVLAREPENSAAHALRREIDVAMEARRRAQEDARAAAAVDAAREQFAKGEHRAAIDALERFTPSAPVADVLNELRVESREIERLRLQAERQAEEQRTAAAAAEEQRKAAARTLDEAAARFRAQDLYSARALTREILDRQPQHQEALALEARIEQAIELRRQLTAGLTTAREHLGANRFADARRALDAVEKIDASAKELATLRRAADAGIRAAEAAAKNDSDAAERRAKEERDAAARAAEDAATREREAAERRAKAQADAAARERDLQQREKEKRGPEPRPSKEPDQPQETWVLDKPSPVELPPPPAPAPPRRNLRNAAILGTAIGAVALAAWGLSRGTSPQPSVTNETVVVPVQPGTVVLDIQPWAKIESISSKADGKPVTTDCAATPCVVVIAPGNYHVRASNPNFPGTIEFDFSVTSGTVSEEHRTVPGFRADEEVSRIIGQRQ